MCSYTTFAVKVDLCAHTYGKIGTFTRRVYSAYILTRTPPPPIPQVDGGGCYREKFFLIFLNPLSTRSDYTLILIFIFLIFARNLRMSVLKLFFLFFLARILLVFLIVSFTPRFLFYHC